ncbi:hypothetical protein A2424_06495 [Candidatus Peribacteria bacterium RIFOXYC1_FULL_54_13]|nr:MAG: hypothetical protein A2424_06495 [Candidatus Peribacteria bacterium RIFOXYC1_FULL_54_13]
MLFFFFTRYGGTQKLPTSWRFFVVEHWLIFIRIVFRTKIHSPYRSISMMGVWASVPISSTR